MKKLLLSSIIMFGICGFVTAQNATGSKVKTTTTTTTAATTTSAAPTPQKFTTPANALTTANPDARPVATTVASDKADAPTAAPTAKPARVQKTEANAAKVSADGTVMTTDVQAKEAAQKTAAPVRKQQ